MIGATFGSHLFKESRKNLASLASLITQCARELTSDSKVFAWWYSVSVLLL